MFSRGTFLPRIAAAAIAGMALSASTGSSLHVTLDYQWVQNPAYNRDRGPVSIVAIRVHVER